MFELIEKTKDAMVTFIFASLVSCFFGDRDNVENFRFDIGNNSRATRHMEILIKYLDSLTNFAYKIGTFL